MCSSDLADRYFQQEIKDILKLVPEGVEGAALAEALEDAPVDGGSGTFTEIDQVGKVSVLACLEPGRRGGREPRGRTSAPGGQRTKYT